MHHHICSACHTAGTHAASCNKEYKIVCRSLVAGMAMVPSSPTSFQPSSLWRHVMGREAVDTSRLFWCTHYHCACKLAVRSQSLVPQVFNNNMSKKSEPKITSCKSSDNWTSITFSPDLAKFGMESLEEHAVMLMRKRVYDMAGVLGKTVKVALIIHVTLTYQHADKLRQCLEHRSDATATAFAASSNQQQVWFTCQSTTMPALACKVAKAA